MTQMGTIRLGKRTDNQAPLIKDFVPLAKLDDVVFTGWDIFEDNMYQAARLRQVLDAISWTRSGRFSRPSSRCRRYSSQYYVKRLNGNHVKTGTNKCDLAEQVRNDIQAFKKRRPTPGHDLVRIDGDLP